MIIPYVISSIGGAIAGASIAAKYDAGIISGTMVICSGLIITAIMMKVKS